MATIATTKNATGALILLLGAAVFLNYVDRGAIGIAAPVMKSDLGLSDEAYGVVFSAFFWIYAPVQLFAGWLCDRFSVYKLMAGGIILWAGSTLLMGSPAGSPRFSSFGSCLGLAKAFPFPEVRRSSRGMFRPNGAASPMPLSPPGSLLGRPSGRWPAA